ncbi:OB-fold domain-containing protein [Pseudomonas sp. PDNC002]|uniref:Zn-ribbon domain-containing OB-fold protein n=1 Tax=Pseudomonas sp. PDNC002 TaxID=2811422 RepID=UPI00196474C9|nr:OB-fold domain-containing protein [Pseudomonas sp. PDNC002]QRY77933.1 OB-fold domain-containing protein [Pseudomonas sp. PDNC002]
MSNQTETTPGIAERPWREVGGRVVLLASRRAGHPGLHFPPLPETSPLRDGSELVELDSPVRLYSYTIVHSSPKANKPPQPLGLADFDEGLRVFARLEYPADRRPRIGDILVLCLVQTDNGPIYAFRPQEGA